MLERAREVVHRLLRSRDAPPDTGERETSTRPGEHSRNDEASSSDPSGAFDRFLRDYKAHIDEEFEEDAQVRQHQPRACGPPDSPSAPTRK